MKRAVILLLILSNGCLCFGQANVGVGTTEPHYPLTIIAQNNRGIALKNGAVEMGFYTSGGLAYMQTWSNHSLSFSTNSGASQMMLANNGNLGIGNISPMKKLDVDATIRIRGGSPAGGKVLVSDANGLGEWKSKNTVVAQSVFVPFSAFVGSIDFMMREVVDGVSVRSPGYLANTYQYQAPLLLPVGTVIKDITWYYFDNNAELDLDFKLVRNFSDDPSAVAVTSSSGTLNLDWSRNVVVNHTLGNYFYWLEISCFSWASDLSLRFKGALINYE